jgi:hypothetical protein
MTTKQGVRRFDRDTHQIILKAEQASLVNGGPHKSLEGAKLQSRWITTTGSPQMIFTLGVSSHHRAFPFLLKP